MTLTATQKTVLKSGMVNQEKPGAPAPAQFGKMMISGLNIVPDNEMDLHDTNLSGGMQCSACGAQPYINYANGWTTIHSPIGRDDDGDVQIHGEGPTSPEGQAPA
jgi:hypothetical protein